MNAVPSPLALAEVLARGDIWRGDALAELPVATIPSGHAELDAELAHGPGVLDHLRLVDLIRRLSKRFGEGADVARGVGTGGDHAAEIGRIARGPHLARPHRRLGRVAHGDLDDPVAV